jgi:hypothetical protein
MPQEPAWLTGGGDQAADGGSVPYRSAGSLERAQAGTAILFGTKVPTTSTLFSLASPSGRGWPKAW